MIKTEVIKGKVDEDKAKEELNKLITEIYRNHWEILYIDTGYYGDVNEGYRITTNGMVVHTVVYKKTIKK